MPYREALRVRGELAVRVVALLLVIPLAAWLLYQATLGAIVGGLGTLFAGISLGILYCWFWLLPLRGEVQLRAVLAIAMAALLVPVSADAVLQNIAPFYVAPAAALAFYRYRRVSWVVVGGVAVLSGWVHLFPGAGAVRLAMIDVIFGVIYAAQVMLAGGAVVVVARLLDANRELARARDQIAAMAVTEERLRFARDLHDLLGHSLSVIVLKADLATRLLAGQGRAAAEVEDIGRVSREALKEVRAAVDGYHQPVLAAEIGNAVAALRAAQIEVEEEMNVADLPAQLDTPLAWVIREGATNVIRHSGAARCRLRAWTTPDTVELEILDDGIGGQVVTPGNGLSGVRARVSAVGGRVEFGPVLGGGFRLAVSLPAVDRLRRVAG